MARFPVIGGPRDEGPKKFSASQLPSTVVSVSPLPTVVGQEPRWNGSAWVPTVPAAATSPVPATYKDKIVAKNPVAYWRKNELTGTTMADTMARCPSRALNGAAVVIDNDAKYNGFPGFCKAQNGTLLAAYYKGNVAPGVGAGGSIYLSKSTDGGVTWSVATQVIAVPGGQFSLGNAGLVTLADGTIILTSFVIDDAEGDSDYSICVRSTDNGTTWSAPITITTGFAWPFSAHANPAYQRTNGDLLMPLYGADTEADFGAGTNNYVRLSKSTDKGLTWADVGAAIPALTGWSYSEASICKRPSDGALILFARAVPPNVAPLNAAPITVAVVSNDEGVTWSAPQVAVYGVQSSPVALGTPDGDIAVMLRQFGAPTAAKGFAISSYDGFVWGQPIGLDQGSPTDFEYGALAYIGAAGANGSLAGVFSQELSGTRADIYFQKFNTPTAAGIPGTYSGAHTLAQARAVLDSNAASVLYAGGLATVPACPSIETALANNTFSIEAWIFNTAGVGHRHIAGTTHASLALDTQLAFFGSAEVYTTATPSGSAWHHVVCVCTAGVITLYKDGAVDPLAVSAASTPTFAFGDWLIGSDGLGHDFGGDLAEIAFYNRALTAAEIADNYAARLI